MQAAPDPVTWWLTGPSVLLGLYVGTAWGPVRQAPRLGRSYVRFSDAKASADDATDIQLWRRFRQLFPRATSKPSSGEDMTFGSHLRVVLSLLTVLYGNILCMLKLSRKF